MLRKNFFLPKKIFKKNLVKITFVIWVWKNFNEWAAQNNYFKKTLHPKMIHCCEAPRSMISNYFCKNQVLRGTFGEIWRRQIHMYPKTYVELKYGACNLKNKVTAHILGLVVKLSWRVAPPLLFITLIVIVRHSLTLKWRFCGGMRVVWDSQPWSECSSVLVLYCIRRFRL